jgi:hypothetical protein
MLPLLYFIFFQKKEAAGHVADGLFQMIIGLIQAENETVASCCGWRSKTSPPFLLVWLPEEYPDHQSNILPKTLIRWEHDVATHQDDGAGRIPCQNRRFG